MKLLTLILFLALLTSTMYAQPQLTTPVQKITNSWFCDSTVVTTTPVHTTIPAGINNGLTYVQIFNDEPDGSGKPLYCNIGDSEEITSATLKLYSYEKSPLIRVQNGTTITTWAPASTCKRRIMGW